MHIKFSSSTIILWWMLPLVLSLLMLLAFLLVLLLLLLLWLDVYTIGFAGKVCFTTQFFAERFWWWCSGVPTHKRKTRLFCEQRKRKTRTKKKHTRTHHGSYELHCRTYTIFATAQWKSNQVQNYTINECKEWSNKGKKHSIPRKRICGFSPQKTLSPIGYARLD